MSDDLVKRLRAKHADTWPVKIGHGDLINEDGPEAADRIEKLETLVEQLRDDNSSLIDDFDKTFLDQESRIEKLESALLGIKIYGNDTMSGPADGSEDNRNWYRGAVIVMKNRARKALEGKDD